MAPIKDSVDELVQSVSCYNPRPLILHGYLGPFVSLYLVLIYSYLTKSAEVELQETWLIAVAALVAAQILSYLCCHWSVHIKCFLTHSKVRVSK